MLISLFLIYFVGRAFYELAHEYDKSRWGFAILGVISFYVGQLIGGFILGIAILLGAERLANLPDLALGAMALPIGLLTCWATYKLLQRQWQKSALLQKGDTLDSDLMN
jgi:hypothetical protein